MANESNLRALSTSEARKIGKKGGLASGKARRERKTLAQIGDMIGGLKINSKKNRAILKQAGIDDEDMINDVGMMFRLNLEAQKGNVRAIELLSKLRGQFNEQISAEISEVKPLVDLTKRSKNGEDDGSK